MFETFSNKFESIFRVIFIIWVCFWGGIDFIDLLYKYASFDNLTLSSDVLGQWWLTTFGNLVAVTLGVLLLFLMGAVPSMIENRKPIKTITLMTVLSCFYYLLLTMVKIFVSIVFKSNAEAYRDLIGLSMWLMPSIILLIIHMFYYSNLRVYNRELAESKETKMV